MIDRFIELIQGRVTDPKFDQAQREAVIDLLVWTMFADRHIASTETERIEAEAKRMDWDSPTGVDIFIAQSMTRTRGVLGDDDKSESYLDDISKRLGDTKSQHRAYKACLLLANVDGQIAPQEKDLLRRIAHRFGLDSDE